MLSFYLLKRLKLAKHKGERIKCLQVCGTSAGSVVAAALLIGAPLGETFSWIWLFIYHNTFR